LLWISFALSDTSCLCFGEFVGARVTEPNLMAAFAEFMDEPSCI
jgi:hypothetical protein